MIWTVILIIVGVLLLAVVALLIYAATQPSAFRVQRSANIQAPAERIFPHINDFRSWIAWSPWEKLDPNLKRTFSGPASGVGSTYEWQGNKKVGQGRMEITEATEPSKIAIKLDFIKPFEAHNTAEFTLARNGQSTDLTWAMLGSKPYLFKVMSVFMDMDKMIGKDFEKGLANLKAITEQPASAAR
jgi:Polyketide cyclase / dehydrase and lipid transport